VSEACSTGLLFSSCAPRRTRIFHLHSTAAKRHSRTIKEENRGNNIDIPPLNGARHGYTLFLQNHPNLAGRLGRRYTPFSFLYTHCNQPRKKLLWDIPEDYLALPFLNVYEVVTRLYSRLPSPKQVKGGPTDPQERYLM
jgi:hypothetical protein